jgi:hypothetical protein
MPKLPTFPTLYDECWQISISYLTKWGYLKPGQGKSATITWSRGEGEHKEIRAQIRIVVSMDGPSPYLELNYRCNGNPIKYRVPIVSVPSNLGKGLIWFFLCPRSGKRCRKLYYVNSYFYHRSAFTRCMYEKQTLSDRSRKLIKHYEKVFGVDKAFELIYSEIE